MRRCRCCIARDRSDLRMQIRDACFQVALLPRDTEPLAVILPPCSLILPQDEVVPCPTQVVVLCHQFQTLLGPLFTKL